MLRKASRRVLALGISSTVLAAGVCFASDVWLATSPASPAPGEEVTVRVMSGDGFRADEAPRGALSIELFQRVWRAGRANLRERPTQVTRVKFRVSAPGTQLIVFNSEPSPSGVTRFAKALIVSEGTPDDSPLRWSEFGQRLEIVPQTDPVVLLERGGKLQIQLLFEREPLAGEAVTAIPEADPIRGVIRAVTNEIGLATLRLNRAGRWLIRTGYSINCKACPAGHERLESTLVLQVGSDR